MKRRQVKFYVMTLLSVVGLSSCTDLEIEESDSFIDEGFQGLENTASAVNQMYSGVSRLGDQANIYALREVTSDALLIPTRGADWGDNGRWRKLHQHEWGLEEQDIITPFDNWNASQLAASQILDERSGATPGEAADAYFIRAYSMWSILDLFGQVPIRDTQLPTTAIPEVFTGAAAVDLIIADLDAAILGLPAVAAGNTDAMNRGTQAAARFLKAKVLLNRHIYDAQLTGGGGTPAAADLAEVISLVDAIAAEGYALEADYFNIFRNTADNETIWWTESGVGNRIWNGLHYNLTTPEQAGGWNGFSTLAEYFDMFEGDPNSNLEGSGQEERRGFVPTEGVAAGAEGTVDDDNDGIADGSNIGFGFLLGQQYGPDGTALEDRQGGPLSFSREFVDGDGAPNLINNSEVTGIRVIKYNPRFGGFTNHSIQFRYADALLMKAEAELRSGTGNATATINELRTVRGVAPIGDLDEAELLEERGKELFVEGWRRNDMIRFGQYLRQWEFKGDTETANDTRLLFPIPLPQLLANPNLLQNPGY